VSTPGMRRPEAEAFHRHRFVSLLAPSQAEAVMSTSCAYDVKFGRSGWKLSLLYYPGFFEEPFPTLAASWVVDLGARSVTSRSYAAEGNPPILHRKELLLPQAHPRVRGFAELTEAAERLGLFTETRTIGMRRPWEARLARLGGAGGGPSPR
jgi:hypothetical protein